VALILLLTFYLSVFVTLADPKLSVLIAIFCLCIGGKRFLVPYIWPLLAIVVYKTALAIYIPGPRPEIGIVLAHPLFDIDCVLLSALVLGGQSVRRQHVLLLGILAVCFIGTVGDFLGHDMTAMLPFKMPDDDYFDKVTQFGGDIARIRGFFPESGVLGAVSLGFATILGLGALSLIKLRACVRYAWVALIGAVGMGGLIFCLTVTKSGMTMIASGVLGFIAVLLAARNPRCRAAAVIICLAVTAAGWAFMVVGPSSLTTYISSEAEGVFYPDVLRADMATHAGTVTRLKCWQLAFASIHRHPLGVGPYGLGPVLAEVGESGFTSEMRLGFSQDIFGLQSALANLIAQTGIIGLGLLSYWLFIGFLLPIRHFLKDGSTSGAMIAAVYGASAVACLGFLFSCDFYPSVAFLIILKFHADAIAQASSREEPAGAQTPELIG
jgi:hypothetical protein